MDLKLGFEQAIANEQLIHGAMKRVHLYPTNNNYQDYFQEAMIIYAQSYVDYLESDADSDKFNVFIFQKLIWRLTDMLRLEQKYFDIHSLEVFDFERVEQESSIEYLDEMDLDCLSEFEKNLFYDYFIEEISLKKLSQKYHCTARNLRYHRNSIQEKLCKRLS